VLLLSKRYVSIHLLLSNQSADFLIDTCADFLIDTPAAFLIDMAADFNL